MTVYKWAEHARQNVTAQKAGEAVTRIIETKGDCSTADLVAAARSKRSLIHNLFTWDDRHAADLYRRTEARSVLNNLRIFVESSGEEISIISHVHVTINGAGTYVTTARAMSEQELRAQVMSEALQGLQGWQKRFHDLEELQPVFAAIAQVSSRP